MTPTDLRAALDRLGISQVAAARAIGINPRTMRRMIAGDWQISRRVVEWVEKQAPRAQ